MINKWERFKFFREGRYLEISYHELDNTNASFSFISYCYKQFRSRVSRTHADNLIMMWESDLIKLLENQKEDA